MGIGNSHEALNSVCSIIDDQHASFKDKEIMIIIKTEYGIKTHRAIWLIILQWKKCKLRIIERIHPGFCLALIISVNSFLCADMNFSGCSLQDLKYFG